MFAKSAFIFLSLSVLTLCLSQLQAIANTPLNGEYSVPVPAELKPFATYELTDVSWTLGAGNAVRLRYTLPVELTGLETSVIELSGELPSGNGTFELKEAYGKADCLRADNKVSCHVVYKALPLDLPKAKAAIAHKFSDPSVFKAKVKVAEEFHADPDGIITFEELTL